MTQKTRNHFSVTASSTFAFSALGSERKTSTDFFSLPPYNLFAFIYLFVCWRRGREVHPGTEFCLALPGAAPSCTEPQLPRDPVPPRNLGGGAGTFPDHGLRLRSASRCAALAHLPPDHLKTSLGKVKTLHATPSHPSHPGTGVRATGGLQTRALRDVGLSVCAR